MPPFTSMQALINRLQFYAQLTTAETTKLKSVPTTLKLFRRDDIIVRTGEPLENAYIIEKGWAIRYLELADGSRQIVNFLLPGDIFDLQVFVSETADHSVQIVSDVTAHKVRPKDFASLFVQTSALSLALWWSSVQEEAILREQIVRNGRRSAKKRIVHMLLELQRRLEISMPSHGNTTNRQFPISQQILADALGLTSVHTNRVLRQLRHDDLISTSNRLIVLQDVKALTEMIDYDSDYLDVDQQMRPRVLSRDIWKF